MSTTDVPGHGSFILAPTSSPWNWRTPQNDILWQGVSGINNPCPSGFRLPTEAEWDAERGSWSSQDAAGAFASPLKLVVAGFRNFSGNLNNVGSLGVYWSSTVDGLYGRYLYFLSASVNVNGNFRAYGYSVRCLKD